MKYLFIFLIPLVVLSCKSEEEIKKLSADDIVDKSIAVAGGNKFENSAIDFNFRGNSYIASREKGKFSFIRVKSEDSTKLIIDELNNEGFSRKIGASKLSNFEMIRVADSMIPRYTASINSVHYFSVLPYGLNDKAVNKTLLGEEQINTKNYYKVKITFNEEGGGEDYEDVFMYWFNKQSFKLDYLAYSYNEDDGVGMRFREAFNERYVNGIRLVDYNNYKSEDSSIQLLDLGKAFDENQLKLLSKIELENVNVDLIDN